MSDWGKLLGVLPDLITLGLRVAEQHAAARAQKPVAELTADDVQAAAAELVRDHVKVEAILARSSGGRWPSAIVVSAEDGVEDPA